MLTWAIGARASLPSLAPCYGGTSRRRFPGSATPDGPPARRAASCSAITPDGPRGSALHVGVRNGCARLAKACDGCGRIASSPGRQEPKSQPQYLSAGRHRKSTYRPPSAHLSPHGFRLRCISAARSSEACECPPQGRPDNEDGEWRSERPFEMRPNNLLPSRSSLLPSRSSPILLRLPPSSADDHFSAGRPRNHDSQPRQPMHRADDPQPQQPAFDVH
jgi:hypothetical protein